MHNDRLIFLDVDGVLNNRTSMFLSTKGIHPPNNLSLLTMDVGCVTLFRILLEESRAKFVISSSWRKRTVEESKEVFNALEWCGFKNAKDFCVGVTPRLDDGGRGIEISCWLEKEQHNNKFVILDDDSFDIHQKDQLVLTNHEIGLTVHDFEKALSILN